MKAQELTRRRFLRAAGSGIVASYLLEPATLWASATSVAPPLQSSARNCIFIFLSGAPSQVDLWDLKEGAWTPSDFEPTSYGDVRWPRGLLPKTAEHLSRLHIVRTAAAWAAVHELGRAWAQVTRNPAGVEGSIAPHIGSVVALETAAARRPSDVLPSFIALDSSAIPGSGYLSAQHAPFRITPSREGLPTLLHSDGGERFRRRWRLLEKLEPQRRAGTLGKSAADMSDFVDQARDLMAVAGINEHFRFGEDDHARYGATGFGDSLVVARNLLEADLGTRFVQVTMGDWDHHSNIYLKAWDGSLYGMCARFDPAFAALLDDLSSRPGVSRATMLDETLIVVSAEFGRTVGPLSNSQRGRDHFLRQSIVFAGGGVRGGLLGRTDATGANAVEYGWSAGREVRPEDVTATIYSAMGVDYTMRRTDDPLGRGFEYVPGARQGVYQPVHELFTA